MLLQQVIAGNQQIARFQRLQELDSVSVPVQYRAERWRKPFYFTNPVESDRDRCHHEDGSFVASIEQHGNGLQCFAQSHIIGQAATDPPFGQSSEPLVAVDLIVP